MDPRELREQAIKDAKCGVILDAARKIFIEKGYWNARMDDIAVASGFSKPSLYNYYPDKESIFLSIAIRENRDLFNKITNEVSVEGQCIQALERLFRILLENMKKHFSMMGSMNQIQNLASMRIDMNKHNDLVNEFKKLIELIIDSIRKIVENGKNAGEIASDLDSTTLALYIGSLIQGAQYDWRRKGKTGDIDSEILQMLTFVKNGASIHL